MQGELSLFLRQLLTHPRQISAAIPSSPRLAKMMVGAIPDGPGDIAEFGPGTGRFIKAMLDSGIPASRLHLFEINPAFTEHLRMNFPNVDVHNRPAQELTKVGLKNLRAIVSGLPLLSMPHGVQRAIVGAVAKTLGTNGVYIQFTYGTKPSIPEDIYSEFGLVPEKVGTVWANLPPATVHIFRRVTH